MLKSYTTCCGLEFKIKKPLLYEFKGVSIEISINPNVSAFYSNQGWVAAISIAAEPLGIKTFCFVNISGMKLVQA